MKRDRDRDKTERQRHRSIERRIATPLGRRLGQSLEETPTVQWQRCVFAVSQVVTPALAPVTSNNTDNTSGGDPVLLTVTSGPQEGGQTGRQHEGRQTVVACFSLYIIYNYTKKIFVYICIYNIYKINYLYIYILILFVFLYSSEKYHTI